MYNGYEFYIKDGSDVLTFPITPPSLNTKIGSNNTVVTLINEGDVNILKSPSLIEIEFEARFPMRKYPYSREVYDFQTYWDKFKLLKENKTPFRFIVARATPASKRTWDTNLQMAMEDVEIKEDASEGDDVIIAFKMRQYKDYGVKILKKSTSSTSSNSNQTTSTATKKRETKTTTTNKSYTVKRGDCLWNIAKKYYGKGSSYTKIYNANKKIIESTAKKYRKGKGSSNGHWIYPGTKLTIPK